MIDSIFDENKIIGLTKQEAARRLFAEGYNLLPSAKPRGIFQIALEIFREPMFLLLLACGILYLISGDKEEALMLLGFVFVVMGITFYQERKTERALEALKDLSSPRALVIRDGNKERIPGREVVRGDILLLSEGDRVPADAVILSSLNLQVDESLLTGESIPVRKKAAVKPEEKMGRPGGDDSPFVYSGTMVVKGQGIAEARAIGINTEIGKIGKALQTLETESTPLQRQTGKIVRNFALMGVLLCIIVIVTYGLTRGSWINGFLAGLSLAMAMLPEEFPVVLTIFLALGAWRISKAKVLTRRIPAVETLGSATLLCVDKTGTLTLNKMSVKELFVRNSFLEVGEHLTWLPERFHEIVEYSLLASPSDPFDPMEKAMNELGNRALVNTEHIHRNWTLLREYPLTREILAITRAWRSPDEHDFVVATKGAPEAIADLCHLTKDKYSELEHVINEMSDRGLRIIGVAYAHFNAESLPTGPHDFQFEFLGLLGLADPVRPKVKDALKECYTAGIRTIMITGDYPGTAKSIARQICLQNPDQTITGYELEKMTDDELSEKIKTVNIFSRMVPEQKLRLVKVLKDMGEIVAMTGDGVNDAPALKSAHIGIAMGGRGTDVAREAASLVLLEDDFGSIVQAAKMGRRIFDNLQKAMMFIFSVHIPIAGLSLIPVLFKWPLALFPVHIVFLELIIDPACSIVFEAEPPEKNIMNRPPRPIDYKLFGKGSLILGLIQGLIILGCVIGVYRWGFIDHGEQEARALAFTTLVVANLGLILTNRSRFRSITETIRIPSPTSWWIIGGTLIFLNLVIFAPFMQEIFRFGSLHLFDLIVCLSVAIASTVLLEMLKIRPIRRLFIADEKA